MPSAIRWQTQLIIEASQASRGHSIVRKEEGQNLDSFGTQRGVEERDSRGNCLRIFVN